MDIKKALCFSSFTRLHFYRRTNKKGETEMGTTKFVTKLEKVISEIRKLHNDTQDNFDDSYHFLSKDSKKFLIEYKKPIQTIFSFKLNRELIQFVSHYIWKL